MDLQIIQPDPGDITWLERLRQGNYVWLSKEQCYGEIEFPYLPPDPGCYSGSIGVRIIRPPHAGQIQRWYISPDGKGFDGKPLMQPVQGNLPDDPPPLDHPAVRQLSRQMGNLTHRVEQLETLLTFYRGLMRLDREGSQDDD